jgi:hypothetical protein
MTSMFFISATDLNGEAASLFVEAHSKEDAIAAWRGHDVAENMDPSEEPNVFIVPPLNGVPTVLEWFKEVQAA